MSKKNKKEYIQPPFLAALAQIISVNLENTNYCLTFLAL